MSDKSDTNPFIEGLKSEIDSRKVLTENGATGYATAGGEGKNLVDFNFQLTAMRGWDEKRIADAYAKAYFEDPDAALRYWAFCGDCRGGAGERRTSRIIFEWLVNNQPAKAVRLLNLIPEYGRWDSLLTLIDGPFRDKVVEIAARQLREDLVACREGRGFSLLAKWAFSENTSSPETRRKAACLRSGLKLSPKEYRKMLSELRAGLKVVERTISANRWQDVDYNAVPSKANLLYRNAFMRHDAVRRREYLSNLANGDASVKINSAATFPCDIVNRYACGNTTKDATLEEMWKALPDYVGGRGNNVLVVADTSGSMSWQLSRSHMTAWSVAQSLAIYFSERASGPFKDKYLMFSANPFWVDFSKCESLFDKIKLSRTYNECSNTDMAKTLRLVLDAAVMNNLSQEDLPSTLMVVSDMQFDAGTNYDVALVDEVKEEFERHGYDFPKIVFWCVSGGVGRNSPVPMQRNKNGVILMSGFSASLMNMALSGCLSPYKALMEQLNSERYDAVSKALAVNR